MGKGERTKVEREDNHVKLIPRVDQIPGFRADDASEREGEKSLAVTEKTVRAKRL